MSTIEINAGKYSARAPSPACGGGRGGGSHLRVSTSHSVAAAVALAPADWLSLAAAPTFAIMALLTGLFGGKSDALCAALQGTSPLSGMVPMYLLMSAFHLGPWLRLIRRTRRDPGDPGSLRRPIARRHA